MSLRLLLAIALGALVGTALAEDAPPAKGKPRHKQPPAEGGQVVITLCDGETSVAVEGQEGEPLSRERAKAAADRLMAEWRRKNPHASWDEAPQRAVVAQNAPQQKGSSQTSPRSPPQIPPAQTQPSTGAPPPGPSAASGAREEVQEQRRTKEQVHTYGDFSARDEQIWRASVDRFVEDGNRAFHDVKRLGGTTGVSCDMCHPNAANTHPETYPKYQVQLGRVALLRDMINWCIENPVRGKPLADDDPTLKALEAFILAQRKGVPLDYGKH